MSDSLFALGAVTSLNPLSALDEESVMAQPKTQLQRTLALLLPQHWQPSHALPLQRCQCRCFQSHLARPRLWQQRQKACHHCRRVMDRECFLLSEAPDWTQDKSDEWKE